MWQNQSGIISEIGVHFSEIIKVAHGMRRWKWKMGWRMGKRPRHMAKLHRPVALLDLSVGGHGYPHAPGHILLR